MRKILTLAAILAIALSVCGCTGDEEETTANSTVSTPVQSESSESAGQTADDPDTTSTPTTAAASAETTAETTAAGSIEVPSDGTIGDDDGWGALIPLQ